MKNDVIIITDNKMKEDHELIDDEELKEFFLTEAKLLCPSVEKEESECEKLQILYNTQQKIVKLLSVMNHCNSRCITWRYTTCSGSTSRRRRERKRRNVNE